MESLSFGYAFERLHAATILAFVPPPLRSQKSPFLGRFWVHQSHHFNVCFNKLRSIRIENLVLDSDTIPGWFMATMYLLFTVRSKRKLGNILGIGCMMEEGFGELFENHGVDQMDCFHKC